MNYDNEFHEWAREHPTEVSAIGINTLLDEIDRLNAYALRLLSDETRSWQCTRCGQRWFGNALVGVTNAVCPECDIPMRPTAEILHEKIDRLTAELEKRRWIAVEERLPDRCAENGVVLDVSVPVYVYPYLKYASATCYDYALEKWLCSAEKTVTHWMPLLPPPEDK